MTDPAAGARTLALEQERLKAIARRLVTNPQAPQVVEKALPKILVPKWRGGIEPMPFDAFSYHIDETTLHDRQIKVLEDCNLLRASQLLTIPRKYNEIALLWGKGAGKDWWCARLNAYATYALLSLQGTPGPYVGLTSTSNLYNLNFAPTEDQARRIFFDYLKKCLRCPAFEPYITDWKSQVLVDEVRFDKNNVYLYSLHSNSSGSEGYNIFMATVDEGDDFPKRDGQCGAYRVRRIIRSSAATRVKDLALLLYISYTREEDGFMMDLKKEAEALQKEYEEALSRGEPAEPPSIYVDRAKTWEVRPDINPDTVKIIRDDYKRDPLQAAAMYECIPKPIEGGFFTMPELLVEAVDHKRAPLVTWHEEVTTIPMRDGSARSMVSLVLDEVRPQKGYEYFIGVDGGEDRDGFAISMMAVDTAPDAAEWHCPACVRDYPFVLEGAEFERVPERLPVAEEAGVACASCQVTPALWNPVMGTKWWWRKAGLHRERQEAAIDFGGKTFHLPAITEVALICIYPRRPTRPGEKGMPPYFESISQALVEMVTRFNVQRVRVDPWNTAQIRQGLAVATGCDVDKADLSNNAQFARATLIKYLTNNYLYSLLPSADRDEQLRKLVRKKGIGVDHPEGGRKDIYDAEAMAAWEAAEWRTGQMEVDFLEAVSAQLHADPDAQRSQAELYGGLL